MAGGIFPGRPFAWNIKCVIFTLVLAGGYWFAPPRNVWILFFLLWIPYIAMTWYDYAYDCKNKMQPTLFPYGRYIFLPFKPPGYQAEYAKLPPEQIEAMITLDHNVTWILLIISIFGIGWYFDVFRRVRK